MVQGTSSDSEKELHLLLKLTLAITASANIVEALNFTLKTICKETAFSAADAWIVNTKTNQLEYITSYSENTPESEPFYDKSQTVSFKKGEGLPGKAWQLKNSFWVKNVMHDPSFIRKHYAEKAGIKAGIAVPIPLQGEVLGVIAFYLLREEEENKEIVRLLTAIGGQLGIVLQQKLTVIGLRDTELRFRSLIDSAPDAIIVANSKGTIIESNTSTQKIFGYQSNELIGKSLEVLMHERYRERHRKGLERFLLTGETRVMGRTIELFGLKKDGREFPIELSIGTWKENDETYFSGMIRDISDRHRTESELAVKTVELDKTKELDEKKDEFIGIASHELKTPLTSLMAYIQLLERTLKSGNIEEAITFVNKTNLHLNNLVNLIDDLLNISKIQKGKLEYNISEFNFQDLLNETTEAVAHSSHTHKIIIEKNVNKVIKADKQRIAQVITNFLTNATKYSPHKDKVIVSAYEQGNDLIVSVEDFGIGIPKDKIPHIFKRFYRVGDIANRFGGLGLGLYISSEIIKRHNGKIWVKSEDGRGSVFYFSLPLK